MKTIASTLQLFKFQEISTSKMHVVVSLCISHMMIRPRLESDLFLMEHRNSQHLSSFGGINFTFGNGLYQAIWAIAAVLSFAHLIGRNTRIIFQLVSRSFHLRKSRCKSFNAYILIYLLQYKKKNIIQSCCK